MSEAKNSGTADRNTLLILLLSNKNHCSVRRSTVASPSEIVQAGGIEAVIDVMRQMPQSFFIQLFACDVLRFTAGQTEKEQEVTESQSF
jgi:hypothetical protein